VSGGRARYEDGNVRSATHGIVDLAAPVHQVDMDHGTWSSRRGKPRAYPICAPVLTKCLVANAVQIWKFCAVERIPRSLGPESSRADRVHDLIISVTGS